IAAFTTMFSTTLTCFDAMPRVMNKISEELKLPKAISSVLIWQILLFRGALSILFFLVSSMRQMVTFATIVSFLTAPILAWLSYRLVLSQPKLQLWTRTEMLLAKSGIIVLIMLSILFIISFL
ncbi:MAG: divalent metal cation transporter, partial [Bacteroidia bacterium]